MIRIKRIYDAPSQNDGYRVLVDRLWPRGINKINTYQWFRDHTHKLDNSYDPSDKINAMEMAFKTDNFPLGIIFKGKERPVFEQTTGVFDDNKEPLSKRLPDLKRLKRLMESKIKE